MIAIVLLFGLGLRLISLNQSLWLDEATSALTTKMSLADFFGKFLPGDFHPPLYYLTLRAWAALFGTSEIALRSLSVLFAIGTIYVVYLIGKELANKEVGIIASLLLATSGLHIYYSQEARMYAMSTFLVSLAIFSFVKILKIREGKGVWVVFSLTLGLIGLTDYLPLLILPVFWLVGFLNKKDVYWWKRFIVSHIILVVAGVVWLPVFLRQLTSGINVSTSSPAWVSVLGTFSLKDILLIPVKFGIGRISFDNKIIYVSFVGILLVIFGFMFLRSIRLIKSVGNLSLIYLWLFVPLALALLVSIKIPVLNYFRFLFVLPALYLIIASGIVKLGRYGKFFLVVIVAFNLASSFMYLTNMKFQREDWREAVKFIEAKRGENSVVVFPALSQMEAYHYYAPNALIYGPEAVSSLHSEIWLMRYAQPISDPSDSTRKKVEDMNYKKTGEYDFNGVTVWKYNGL